MSVREGLQIPFSVLWGHMALLNSHRLKLLIQNTHQPAPSSLFLPLFLPLIVTQIQLSNRHSFNHSESQLRRTFILGHRLLLSSKGTRWFPPRARWKQNTDPQTTHVTLTYSGTLYKSLYLNLRSTGGFFSVCMCFLHNGGLMNRKLMLPLQFSDSCAFVAIRLVRGACSSLM